jgi:hypothetical protein
MLAPFAILLVGGLQELLSFTRRRCAALIMSLLIAAVCLTSELYMTAARDRVFMHSENFYHLTLR